MAAIPTILKGDDSGAISITMATGRTYTGATLVVAYQGVTRSFTNLTPGQTITITFTHEETANFALKTAPMLMRLIGQYGAEETVENAEARIRVTDCLAEVNAGGSFIVQPGGSAVDPTKVPITDVGDMAARYTLADLQAKVNQIVRVLAQRSLLSLLLSACCLSSFGAVSTQTARLDALYNDSLVVTNVTGGGDVTYLDATNAALAVVGPVTNALTSVSNAAVSAYALATNALPRAEVTNAVDALVAVRPAEESELWSILNKSEGFEITSYFVYEITSYLDYGVYWKDENGNEGGNFDYNEWHSNEFYRVLQDDAGIASPITVKFERHAEINRYGLATTNALNDAIATRQHLLPYPTNEIPYAAVSGGPTQYTDAMVTNVVRNDTQLWQDCVSPIATNIVTNALANAVTTYAPTNDIVALNQSVQYVVGSGSPLAILAPSSVADGCRDWLVYVNATADTPLNLDALGGVLVADAAYTNACVKDKVTMLCFTEMTNNVFVIGRQELTPVK